MAQTTTKLSLTKPEITDEIEFFIASIANNFQKLDDISTDYAAAAPTNGIREANHIVLAKPLQIGGYIGWVNLRKGMATPIWTSLKQIAAGETIVPKNDNGHYYTCTQAGYTGVTEPIFPVSTNGTVSDTRGGNTWSSNHLYSINDIVFPTIDNSRFYVCKQSGESGNTEPSWSNVDGATTYDKNAVWHGYRIVKWKENGVSALYRPFGKIE